MTGPEFAATHGDPTTWTPADHETCQNLAALDAARRRHPATATAVDYTRGIRAVAGFALDALQRGDHAEARDCLDGIDRLTAAARRAA